MLSIAYFCDLRIFPHARPALYSSTTSPAGSRQSDHVRYTAAYTAQSAHPVHVTQLPIKSSTEVQNTAPISTTWNSRGISPTVNQKTVQQVDCRRYKQGRA